MATFYIEGQKESQRRTTCQGRENEKSIYHWDSPFTLFA